jgi:hypothetical protein
VTEATQITTRRCPIEMTADEIRWHIPRFSYREPGRQLTYSELWSVTEVEEVFETLTLSEIACWILDLIGDSVSLKTTIHACMDALNHAHKRRAA